MYAAVRAIRHALPERWETVDELAGQYPDWPIERIFAKTGISGRHLAAEDECASDLAAQAAEKLFGDACAERGDIDYVLFCTQTPDYLLPTTACVLQDRLGLPRQAGALDFNLGCSGYIYGLSLAKGLIETGQARRVLLLTADTYSKLIHPEDRSVRTLFGDAGAATLVDAVPAGSAGDGDGEPVGPFVFGTDGSGKDELIVPESGMRNPRSAEEPQEYTDAHGNKRSPRHLYMNGAEILQFSLREVPAAVDALLSRADLDIEAVDGFVFHQASKKVLGGLRQKLGIPQERFHVYLEEIGNTVSCSIPIALKKAAEDGRVRPGQRLMLVGFGVGYSWGGVLIRWLP